MRWSSVFAAASAVPQLGTDMVSSSSSSPPPSDSEDEGGGCAPKNNKAQAARGHFKPFGGLPPPPPRLAAEQLGATRGTKRKGDDDDDCEKGEEEDRTAEDDNKKAKKKKSKKEKKESESEAPTNSSSSSSSSSSIKILKKGAKKFLKAAPEKTMKLKDLAKALLVTAEDLKAMAEANSRSFRLDGKRIVYEKKEGGNDDGDECDESSASASASAAALVDVPPPAPSSTTTEASFPYPVDPDDHCETPVDAYSHVSSLLRSFPPGSSAEIYDPYYCDGSVVRRLASLGFPNVSNTKSDCYKVWGSASGAPPHDVFLTNPPYSGEHIESLMKHLCPGPRPAPGGERPWFLLMPQFVHKKDFYADLCGERTPFYLVPKKRYVYLPPDGLRSKKKSGTEKKSSPFVSMWFIWGGSKAKNDELIRTWERLEKKKGECEIARSKSALRDLRRK